MRDVFIVDAVRTPLGKRGGGLSTMHPAELLVAEQRAVVERAKLDPALVDQVVGGCVSQVGEQSFNIARTAWLSAGLPLEVASTTVDSQCGSSQQATTLAAGLVGSGLADVVVSCAGIWAPRIGAMVGMATPLQPLAHLYARTGRIEALARIAATPELENQRPILRHQDRAAQRVGDPLVAHPPLHAPRLLARRPRLLSAKLDERRRRRVRRRQRADVGQSQVEIGEVEEDGRGNREGDLLPGQRAG